MVPITRDAPVDGPVFAFCRGGVIKYTDPTSDYTEGDKTRGPGDKGLAVFSQFGRRVRARRADHYMGGGGGCTDVSPSFR